MKKIGLIGGMSWESSVEYYKIINRLTKEKLGGSHSAETIMYSVDFEKIKNWQFEGDWKSLTKEMVDVSMQLEKAGAELLVLCTNTMHKCADDIQKNIAIPFLHIVDPTAEKILEHKIKKIGLLGTRFTMEEDFYKKRLTDKFKVDVVIPDQADRDCVHQVIYDELVLGQIKPESKTAYLKIIDKLIAQGAEGIILGCTEIGLLIKQEDVAVPAFDTTYLHAARAVELAIADS